MDIPRWSYVGVAKRVRGVNKECSSCQGPRRRGVGGAFSGVMAEVSSGGIGNFQQDDVRVKPPVGAGIGAISTLGKPVVVVGAPVPAGL